MSLVKIVSLMSTSIILEDLSIHLPSIGSAALVDADSANKSQDLKKYKEWVRIEPVPDQKPVAVWPFIKSLFKKSPSSPSVEIVDNHITISQQEKSDLNEISELRKSMAEISAQNKIMLELLSRQPQTVQFVSNTNSEPKIDSFEPMFIPNKIMPKNAEVHIAAREGEVSVSDMDESLAALRLARKSK